MWKSLVSITGAALFGAVLLASMSSRSYADDFSTALPAPAPTQVSQASSGTTDSVSAYFDNWFARVDHSQAEQPHWMTPVATVTPRLEEEFRYDQSFAHLGNGGELNNFGGGKGLELIPSENVELIFGVPPFEEREYKKPATGMGDYPFLLVKYRLLSANEEHGNYILTAFLQGSAPTGIAAFTNHTWLVTPTLAGGVGWGDFDVQMTVGESFPTSQISAVGRSTVWNTAFQYHLWNILWPEFEINDTYWQNGPRGGKNQILLTPGIVFGRFPIVGRTKLIIGAGYQVAVAPKTQRDPALVPTLANAFVLTTRLAF